MSITFGAARRGGAAAKPLGSKTAARVRSVRRWRMCFNEFLLRIELLRLPWLRFAHLFLGFGGQSLGRQCFRQSRMVAGVLRRQLRRTVKLGERIVNLTLVQQDFSQPAVPGSIV